MSGAKDTSASRLIETTRKLLSGLEKYADQLALQRDATMRFDVTLLGRVTLAKEQALGELIATTRVQRDALDDTWRKTLEGDTSLPEQLDQALQALGERTEDHGQRHALLELSKRARHVQRVLAERQAENETLTRRSLRWINTCLVDSPMTRGVGYTNQG
ncbi:MAG: hypothetical protein AAGI01_11645, partial [Myxococcota bacterium]